MQKLLQPEKKKRPLLFGFAYMMAALLWLVGGVVAGCQCGDAPGIRNFECETTADCKKGQRCAGGKCIEDDNDGDGFSSDRDCDDKNKNVFPGRTEICDNKIDDNCDGKIDETPCNCLDGSDKVCGEDKGSCRTGKQLCVAGKWGNCEGAVLPEREKCNNVDDDCDGEVDEDFPLKGKQCEMGKGVCKAQGQYVCSSDQTVLVCDAVVGTPQDEKCDGLDNDCDGLIDEIPQCQKRYIQMTSFSTATDTWQKDGRVFRGMLGQNPLLSGQSSFTSGKWTLRGGFLAHPNLVPVAPAP